VLCLLNALDSIDVILYGNSLLLHSPTMARIDGLKNDRGSNILEMILPALPLLNPNLLLSQEKA